MIRDKSNIPETAARVKAVIKQGYCRLPGPVLAGVLSALLVWWLIPLVWPALQRSRGFERMQEEKYLLVLPFTNPAGDPASRAFCNGLVETLSSKLSQMEQLQKSLRVVPAADVLESRVAGAGEALQEFGVNLVVDAGMQRFENSFSLSLNLVDTETLQQLSSEVITVRTADFAALQEGMVEKLAEMLDLELPPESRLLMTAGGTKVPQAYEFYLQALGHLQSYREDENLETAINMFEQAVGEDSVYASACAGLGKACWCKYETTRDSYWMQRASQHCKRAAELNELLAAAHVTLGMIHEETGLHDEAVKEFRLALELDPADISAYRKLADAYIAQGRFLLAELTYQKAIELNPHNCVSYGYLGAFYRDQGRYEDAAAQFHRAVQVNPMYAKGFGSLGGVYFLLGRRQDAEQMYLRSLEIRPSWQAYSNLASCYFYQERYEDAASVYEKALEKDSTDYRIWANLAAAYYWIADEQESSRYSYRHAIILAEEELRHRPGDQKLLNDLALYCATIGEREKTQAVLQQLVDSEPDILDVVIGVGYIYEVLGERELALKWIEKALEKEDYALMEIESFPGLEELREDERFQVLVRRFADKTD